MATSSASLVFALICATALVVPLVSADAVNVTFVVDFQLSFGNGFVITGNATALGSWVPQNSPQMLLVGDSESYWAVTVELDAGIYVEYKPVKVVYDTLDPLEWYNGDNLKLTVPSEATTVVINWNGSGLASVVA